VKVKLIETTEQRLDRLEARIAELAEAIGVRQSASLAAPPGTAERPAAPPVPLAADDSESLEPVPDSEFDADAAFPAIVPNAATILSVLTALGTSFLVLGGALLIRTITDAGAVPRSAGIAAGFVYALVWIFMATRLAANGRRIGASFLGVTAVIIGDPLLFEAVTRFHAIGPWLAAVALVILTGACLAAGKGRDLAGVAWFATLAAAAAAGILSIVTGSVVPFAAALLTIGIAAVWLWPGAGHLSWNLLRWPAAAAADAIVLWLGVALLTAEPVSTALQEAGPLLVPVALALPLLYVGSFLAQVLRLRRNVGVFEVLQTFGSLTGLGTAVIALRAGAGPTEPLGAAAILAAGGCYAIALGTLERRSGSHRNISWCATFALALALAGTALLLPGWLVTWIWLLHAAAAAIASAIRPVLRLHAAGFVAAAAWQSGLLSAAVGLLALPPGRAPESFSEAALASLSAGMLCLPMIARPVATRRDIAGHIGRIALSVIACLGACGLLVFLLRPVAVSSGAVDPAAMALIRSAVLAAAAVCVALLRKRTGFPELGWLAYALVVIGGFKLVLEDVPAGRALTLFLAFGLYGTALLWLPRILRAARNGPAAVRDESGKQ
jgi:hypothetical protein